jgi:hypothetical protein
MGLDVVELVMAIEERFEIDIPDDEASNARTVGDLYQLVLTKVANVPETTPATCLTSAAFYRTRRGLLSTLPLNRREIRPSTPLAPLLPLSQRRRLWKGVQRKIELRLPNLERPWWLRLGLILTGLVAVCAPLGTQRLKALWPWDLVSLSLLGLLLGGILIVATPFLAVGFPSSATTVGDLSRVVLAGNQARLSGELKRMSPQDVWEILVAVIVKQVNVDASRIVPEAGIVDDLGIG